MLLEVERKVCEAQVGRDLIELRAVRLGLKSLRVDLAQFDSRLVDQCSEALAHVLGRGERRVGDLVQLACRFLDLSVQRLIDFRAFILLLSHLPTLPLLLDLFTDMLVWSQ